MINCRAGQHCLSALCTKLEVKEVVVGGQSNVYWWCQFNDDYQWTAQPATYCAAALAMIVSAHTGRYLHCDVDDDDEEEDEEDEEDQNDCDEKFFLW